jgi:hypothetical protein
MIVEVRCCCDCRLLGHVDIAGWPRGTIWPGAKVRFLAPAGPRYVGESPHARICDPPVYLELSEEVVELEVGIVHDDYGDRFPALKSNHYPLETLRRIPTFVEA